LVSNLSWDGGQWHADSPKRKNRQADSFDGLWWNWFSSGCW